MPIKLLIALILTILTFLTTLSPIHAAPIPTIPNLKVAFIGDSTANSNFEAVLQLISQQNADLVLHQGDFSYTSIITNWTNDINTELGSNFPYIGSIGNHDVNEWGNINNPCNGPIETYAEFFRCRMDQTNINYQTHTSSNYTAEFEGLKMVFVGQTNNKKQEYADYINTQLTGDQHLWKICSWHKNQTDMQTGSKGNEMGWAVYENCKNHGAIVATGHEHAYTRTKTLTHFENKTINPSFPDRFNLRVEPGSTFAFVSGIGGQNARNQDTCNGDTTYPYGNCNWWAKIYTSDSSVTEGGAAKPGALFITFNINNDPNQAKGEFINIDGTVIDEFTITTTSPPTATPTETPSLSLKDLLTNWLTSIFDQNNDQKVNILDLLELIINN